MLYNRAGLINTDLPELKPCSKSSKETMAVKNDHNSHLCHSQFQQMQTYSSHKISFVF